MTYLQMRCKPDLLAGPEEPFCGIVLIPLVAVSVIHRELVVEVMVSFSHRDHGGNNAILGCQFIIIWLLAKPVTQRIHAES